MNKSYLFLLSVLLIGLASASISVNATLDVHNITADVYLDTSDMALDEQTIVYESYEIEGLLISELLKGFDFRFEINNGDVKFTKINISTPYTKMLVENILNGFSAGFDVEDLNANPELVNGWLTVAKGEGNGYVEKVGNYYKIQFDRGFGDLPIESLQLEEISYSSEFIEKLFSFDADFSNVELKDGTYEIPFSFGVDSNEQAVASLTIINFDEITKYIPEDETTLEVIPQIIGLELGTEISVEEEITTDYTELINTTQLKVLNITASQSTSGEIFFNVNKSLITNKDKVALYVLENITWTKLNTTFLNETATDYQYQAYTPHFSIFTIAEEKVIIPPSDDTSGSSGGSSRSSRHSASSVPAEVQEVKPIEEIEVEEKIPEELNLPKEKPKEDNLILVLLGTLTIGSILLIFLIYKLRKNKSKEYLRDSNDNKVSKN